jgi:porin
MPAARMQLLSAFRLFPWLALLAIPSLAHAGHEVTEDETTTPEAREYLTGDWGGLRNTLDEHGVYLSLEYTGEVIGNPTGGKRRGSAFEGSLDLSLELDLEPLLGWKGGYIAASAVYPHGPAYSERYIGDLNGVTNLESYDSLRLLELWFEQKVILGKTTLSLRVGSQALDAEFWLNDKESLLINNTFGTPTVASGDFPIPSYALAALGARFAAVIGKPSEHAVLAQFGAYDGNPASGILPDPTPGTAASSDFNKHGTDFALRHSEGALLIGEIGFTFNQRVEEEDEEEEEESDDKGADDKTVEEPSKNGKKILPPQRGLSGTYRLGVIHHTDRFADIYDATTEGMGVETGRSASRSVKGNSAIYVTVEQELWREPGSDTEGLSFFGRAALATEKQNRYDYSWETGLHYRGLLPGRPEDQLALGFGLVHLNPRVASAVRAANGTLGQRSAPAAAREVAAARAEVAAVRYEADDVAQVQDDLRDAVADLAEAKDGEREARQEDENNRAARISVPDYEAVIELTYRAQVTRWLALQPDVQWVIHPGGSTAIDNALVLSLRASVAF